MTDDKTTAPPAEADEPVVLYERRGATAVITMNRPKYRNAQNSVMTYALDAAFERAVGDDDVPCSCWPAPATTSAPAMTSAPLDAMSMFPMTARP